jgi:predicted GNAT superfamily acetyltransferase
VADAQVHMLSSAEQLDAAAALLWDVWRARDGAARNEVISGIMLRTLSLTGNYVAGEFEGDRLIGCVVGIIGSGRSSRPDHLHSYIVGVIPGRTDQGVGYRMKRHQRQWALDHGLAWIGWTFDPLVTRSAYFSLCKLGATVVSYEPEFYGLHDDGVNSADHTDRLVVEWDLRAPSVERAMIADRAGARRHAVALPGAELIAVSQDIQKVRDESFELAAAERLSVRDRFQSLLARGYRIAGMSRDREYVMLPADEEPTFEE